MNTHFSIKDPDALELMIIHSAEFSFFTFFKAFY